MKLSCFLVFLLFFPFTIFAQCDFEVNKLDEFTKERSVVLKKTKLVSTGMYNSSIYFSMKGNTVMVTVEAEDKKIRCYNYSTTMRFRFKNGDVVTLENEGPLECETLKIFKATIDDNAFKVFKDQELEKIRLTGTIDYFDYEVNVKYRFDISKQVECIEMASK